MSVISPSKLTKVASAFALLSTSDLGNQSPGIANAIELMSGVESNGMIRMEVEKVPLQFTQVSAESSAAIGEGKARVDLANNWNYGYIGEFHLGSGTPQKIRAMFDTGSANSWIRSTEANSQKNPREV